MERKSDGAKTDAAKEQRSEDRRMERKSDGATDGKSDGAKSNGATERWSVGASEQISDGGTERRIDSNKTKISQLLNSYRKIGDSRDLEQGFSNALTVGVLENYQ